MAPRNAPSQTQDDPDGLMEAAAQAAAHIEANPLPPPEPQPEPTPVPPPEAQSIIQPVGQRTFAELNPAEQRAVQMLAARLVENQAFVTAANELRGKYFAIIAGLPLDEPNYVHILTRSQTAVSIINDIVAQVGILAERGKWDDRIVHRTARGR
jgi:hypothetical protein